MESLNISAEKAREVPVSFVRDDSLVPEPKERITTTDEHGRAPRNRGTRRIDFVDDGKLFEGHFTVQATNLKSIIQYLLDRHNEQDVIIQDLQKQVHMLRSRSLKSSKRGGGGGMEGGGLAGGRPSSNGGISTADMNKRLRSVEQFLQLWGVRLGEVADLVEEYGDPTITPDAYTSFLLDLPAFRLTRREARALMASASQPTAASVNMAAASDTASRRRASISKREAGSASAAGATAGSSEERPRSVTPERRSKKPTDSEDAAGATLEKANAALEKAEMLLAELHSVAPRSASQAPAPKPRRLEQPSKSASGGAAVDAEARADIEELGEYVMQRFDELEARTAMALRAPSSSAHADRSAPQHAGGGSAKKNAAAASTSPPRGGGGAGARTEDFVDAVAREDAATSLDLLEELETTMERRFKELSSAVANVSARTAALAKNNSGSGGHNDSDRSQHRVGSPATSSRGASQPAAEESRKAREQSAAAAEDGAEAANLRSLSATAKKSASPSRKGATGSDETSTLIPVLPSAPAALLIDQAARDETVALAERVNDLEEELVDRWQAMEERLRIIGRAAMKQGITNATGGAGMSRAPVVDRKAREDAAMSLMRLQQVERELAQLKRNAAAAMPPALAALPAEGAMALPTVMASHEPSQPLRDTYGSKVADLEREVEQRMAEVNQAIAQLRGTGTPLTLSPQKRATDKGPVVPNPPTHAPLQLESGVPLPTAGQLTLRSGGDEHAALSMDAAPANSVEAEERRRAAQQSLLELGHNADDYEHRYSGLPRASLRVGGRRTTISRLRSPDVPPFGSHLVQREVVDIPLVVERAAAGDGADGSAAQRDGAAATTPVRAVRRVSNAKGELPTQLDEQGHSRSPPRSSKVGGSAARVSVT